VKKTENDIWQTSGLRMGLKMTAVGSSLKIGGGGSSSFLVGLMVGDLVLNLILNV